MEVLTPHPDHKKHQPTKSKNAFINKVFVLASIVIVILMITTVGILWILSRKTPTENQAVAKAEKIKEVNAYLTKFPKSTVTNIQYLNMDKNKFFADPKGSVAITYDTASKYKLTVVMGCCNYTASRIIMQCANQDLSLLPDPKQKITFTVDSAVNFCNTIGD